MAQRFQIETLALPFTFGMAIGLAFGRIILQSTLLGLLIGLALTAVLFWIRNRLVS